MRTTATINNTAHILDSREIIARIEDLISDRDDYAPTEDAPTWSAAHEDDAAELIALVAVRDQAEGYGDWDHGETLIRDSYFEEYAEQLADDIGAIDTRANWPLNCIDWAKAARELQQDYTQIDFDGITYWMRA